MFDEIARDVFAVPHRIVEGKAAIVFGEERALAIDACNDLEEGRAMAEFIDSRGFRPDLIVYTHGHADHVGGSGAFADAVALAHPLAVGQIRCTIARIADRDGLDPATLAAGMRWPNVLCASGLDVDLGGRLVRLIPTPGHSDDSVCAYMPDDRLLVGGDTVVTAIVPAITDGDSTQLLASLEQLARLPTETLVPGHGAVVTGAAEVRTCIEWEANYLRTAKQVVAAVDGNVSAAVDRLGEAVGDRLPPDRYRMTDRHRNVVEKVTAELGLQQR